MDKIQDEEILDSEIIQTIESAKKKYFSFYINWTDHDTYFKWTFLIFAVIHNREELVRYLLADPRISVNYGFGGNNTAIHLLCDNYNASSISILKLLIGHKDIDVNIQNWKGRTGLHRLCIFGHKEGVRELLIDARVDLTIRSNEGKTALDIAVIWGHLLRIPNEMLVHDIVRMIIEEYA